MSSFYIKSIIQRGKWVECLEEEEEEEEAALTQLFKDIISKIQLSSSRSKSRAAK
jgi:uncharacterized protein YllA (UPF0747 family)